MKKSSGFSLWLGLVCLAMMTPISIGYFLSFVMFLVLMFEQFKVGGAWQPKDEAFSRYWRGSLVFLALITIAVTVQALRRGFDGGSIIATNAHLAVKYGLLPIVLILGVQKVPALDRRWLWGFAGGMVLLLAYCIAQRITGIDWVHGFDAKLPPNRFAYGVFRISGFMGHPLTLAYNLVLVVGFAVVMLVDGVESGKEHSHNQKLSRQLAPWAIIAVASILILVLGGSRFPLVTLMGAIALTYGGRLWAHGKILGVAAAGFAVLLALEGSVIGRFAELFGDSRPWTERIPRLQFWLVHAHVFWDHPLLGLGTLGKGAIIDSYYALHAPTAPKYSAHNIFLQVAAEWGAIGLIGFLFLLRSLWRAAKQAYERHHSRALRLIFWVIVIAGMMQNVYKDSEFIYACSLCIALALRRQPLPTAAT